ncbi:MAG: ShlB/FhaC/HecB family hemolysin secretion/activation protein [Oscillatoria sp. PMC 1068.18]|nr:ShlB/FhaC/HecB family hemolysin secretion/activation protein [Oscillatoria sp. PMC 1076.18]MEC4989795.1 ShlB/FhaC/HecB family hemolysin secretion/activation protein [Oscillatoria sp. PMC 1068.18]
MSFNDDYLSQKTLEKAVGLSLVINQLLSLKKLRLFSTLVSLTLGITLNSVAFAENLEKSEELLNHQNQFLIPNFQEIFAQTPNPSDLRPPTPETPSFTDEIEPQSPPETPLEVPTPSEQSPESSPTTLNKITVTQFNFEGNTVFSDEELRNVLEEYTNREISFAELLAARSRITQLYLDNDYLTSGAYIPLQQRLSGGRGEVTIQIVEGSISDIRIQGTERLNSSYIRDRLRLGTATPLNKNRLIQALQLLQLDSRIRNISAELSQDIEPGKSILDIQVEEADTFNTFASINNGRAPSVGSFRRGGGLVEENLLGFGDTLFFSYNNTDGSDNFDVSYTLPVNPRDGTLSFAYGTTSSDVIEPPFDELDIDAESRYYQLSFRQPIWRSPTEEFAVGITASRQESETSLLDIPFPLSPGADDEGRIRVSALRFFQDWRQQGSRYVYGVRSQFTVGIDAFDATINDNAPDSQFFAWRGQGQLVYLLGGNNGNPPLATTMVVRADVQFAAQELLSLEQFALGGFNSIRGYRQDALLTDNGAFLSAEVRFPIVRIPEWETAIQLIPFLEIGTGWNNGENNNPDPSTLAAIGLGLQLIQSDRFSARLDWGIPLIELDSTERTWQENGIYFSVEFYPF